ncbi:hypothetical protein F4802DRAFT_598620 [Xylaria palmicola]|nr:hypothetical protein F4802DRAFT_598620 [Xylaria palmicola]
MSATTAPTRPDAEVVSIFDPVPHRYILVPGTDSQLVTECRARTRAIGRAVYVVEDARGEVIGFRVPHYVLESVIIEESLRKDGGGGGGVDDETAGGGERGGSESSSDSDAASTSDLSLDQDGGSESELDDTGPGTPSHDEDALDWVVGGDCSDCSHSQCGAKTDTSSGGSIWSTYNIDRMNEYIALNRR